MAHKSPLFKSGHLRCLDVEAHARRSSEGEVFTGYSLALTSGVIVEK
jgi:hypothetical protein